MHLRPRPRPWIQAIPPYRAGRQAATGAGSLASNETIDTSPSAIRAAAASLTELHRYPDPLAERLRTRLAMYTGASVDQILVGGGSDELMFMLTTAYASAGGVVVSADPGYWGHEYPARIAGAEIVKVPLSSWTHDLHAMAREECDLLFICNPHNPTGTVVSGEQIESLIEVTRARLVVVDEAYIEFADDPGSITSMPAAIEERCVVLRTMSKYFGLAALRIGYLTGPAEIVETLVSIRQPFSVNAVGQAAAVAALDDIDHQRSVRSATMLHKHRMIECFEAAGHTCVPSEANFVLVLTRDEESLVERLASWGISVRPGSQLGVPGSVRVTVPSAQGLELLQAALGTERAASDPEGERE